MLATYVFDTDKALVVDESLAYTGLAMGVGDGLLIGIPLLAFIIYLMKGRKTWIAWVVLFASLCVGGGTGYNGHLEQQSERIENFYKSSLQQIYNYKLILKSFSFQAGFIKLESSDNFVFISINEKMPYRCINKQLTDSLNSLIDKNILIEIKSFREPQKLEGLHYYEACVTRVNVKE